MNKGSLDVTIDSAAITEIIIFANEARIAISDRSDAIRGICDKMTKDETLNGGDGEAIKEAFRTLGSGYLNIEQSFKYIVDNLNTKLEDILKMTRGDVTADAIDESKKTANNMGVLKRD